MGLTFSGNSIGNTYQLLSDDRKTPVDVQPVHRLPGSVVRFSGGDQISRSYSATEWGLSDAVAVQARIDEVRGWIGTTGTLTDDSGTYSDMALVSVAVSARNETWVTLQLTYMETL